MEVVKYNLKGLSPDACGALYGCPTINSQEIGCNECPVSHINIIETIEKIMEDWKKKIEEGE